MAVSGMYRLNAKCRFLAVSTSSCDLHEWLLCAELGISARRFQCLLTRKQTFAKGIWASDLGKTIVAMGSESSARINQKVSAEC